MSDDREALQRPFTTKIDGVETRFSTMGDVREFFDREAKAWRPFGPAMQASELLAKVMGIQNRPLNLAEKLLSNPGYERFQTAMTTEQEAQWFVSARSAVGQHIRQVFARHQGAGALLLAREYIKRGHSPVGDAASKMGIWAVDAALAAADPDGQLAANAGAIDALLQQWNKTYEGFSQRLSEATATAEAQNKQRAETFASDADNAGQLLSSVANALDDHRKTMEKDLSGHDVRRKAIEDSFREYMTLAKPAEFWEEQQTEHRKLAWRYFITFAIVTGITLLLIGWNFDAISARVQALNQGPLNLAAVALVTAPALLFFWVLRHIARLFVTHHGLATDAEMRGNLIQTYLGLVNDSNSKITGDDRKVVLEAVFRPVLATGEDGGPGAQVVDFVRSLRN